jgi:hypothetical protein
MHTRMALPQHLRPAWDVTADAKAPAAICRKVIQAKFSGERQIEIWGDGGQTRLHLHRRLSRRNAARMHSDVTDAESSAATRWSDQPAGRHRRGDVELVRTYDLSAPGAAAAATATMTASDRFGWAPSIRLEHGMEKTYAWIYDEIHAARCRRRGRRLRARCGRLGRATPASPLIRRSPRATSGRSTSRGSSWRIRTTPSPSCTGATRRRRPTSSRRRRGSWTSGTTRTRETSGRRWKRPSRRPAPQRGC